MLSIGPFFTSGVKSSWRQFEWLHWPLSVTSKASPAAFCSQLRLRSWWVNEGAWNTFWSRQVAFPKQPELAGQHREALAATTAAGILWCPELSGQSCSGTLRLGYRKGSEDFKAVLWVFICSLKIAVFLNMHVFNLNTIWFCWPMQCWYFYPNLYVFLCALPGLVLGKWLECCWVSAAGIMSRPTFPVSLGHPCDIGRKN